MMTTTGGPTKGTTRRPVAWGPGRLLLFRLRASWALRDVGKGLAAATAAAATGSTTARGRGRESTDGFFSWWRIATDGSAGWRPHADQGLGGGRGRLNVPNVPGRIPRPLWRLGTRRGDGARGGNRGWSENLLHQIFHPGSFPV